MSKIVPHFVMRARDPDLVAEDLALCAHVLAMLPPQPRVWSIEDQNPGGEYHRMTDEQRQASRIDWRGWDEAKRKITGFLSDPLPDDLFGFSPEAWASARSHGFFLGNQPPPTPGERDLWAAIGADPGPDRDPARLLGVCRYFEGSPDVEANIEVVMNRGAEDGGWTLPLAMATTAAREAVLSGRADIYERCLDWHGPTEILGPNGDVIYTAPEDLEPGTPESIRHEVAFLETLPPDAVIFSFEGESFCTVQEEVINGQRFANHRETTTWSEEVGGQIKRALDDAGIVLDTPPTREN